MIAKTVLNKFRIWELDGVRGLMILAMLIGHLWDTVYLFCIKGYYNIDPFMWIEKTDPLHFWFKISETGVIEMAFVDNPVVIVWHRIIQASFFVVSGICCTFSRDHLKSGIKYLIWGICITGYTYILYRVTGISELYMRFGVIMCMAICHLLYEFVFKNAKTRILVISAIPMIVVGYFFMFYPIHSGSSILHMFGVKQNGDINEYFPIFPYLGWLLLGVVAGRKWYSSKKSLVLAPRINKLSKPIQWLGRNSGIIYLSHIFIYRTAFPIVGYILKIM